MNKRLRELNIKTTRTQVSDPEPHSPLVCDCFFFVCFSFPVFFSKKIRSDYDCLKQISD